MGMALQYNTFIVVANFPGILPQYLGHGDVRDRHAILRVNTKALVLLHDGPCMQLCLGTCRAIGVGQTGVFCDSTSNSSSVREALFFDKETRAHERPGFPCVMAYVATFFPAPSTIAGYASASAGTWTTPCSTDLGACITWQPALCRFIAYLDQAYGCLQQHCAPTTSQLALATVLMLIEARCAALPHTLRCTDASKALCTANQ